MQNKHCTRLIFGIHYLYLLGKKNGQSVIQKCTATRSRKTDFDPQIYLRDTFTSYLIRPIRLPIQIWGKLSRKSYQMLKVNMVFVIVWTSSAQLQICRDLFNKYLNFSRVNKNKIFIVNHFLTYHFPDTNLFVAFFVCDLLSSLCVYSLCKQNQNIELIASLNMQLHGNILIWYWVNQKGHEQDI